MFTDKIKNVLLGIYALPALNRMKVLSVVKEIDYVESIGVLYSAIDEDSISESGEKLVSHFKTKFLPVSYKAMKADERILAGVSLKDVSFFGTIRDETVKNFIDTRFDCMVNLADIKDPLVRFILSKSNARYKAGVYSYDYYKYYDLAIKLEKEDSYSTFSKFGRILSYVKNLA